jgi:3',5'-cyclic AMP phosphodiesterase CpdA
MPRRPTRSPLAFCVVALAFLVACVSPSPAPQFSASLPHVPGGGRLVVVGDTQRTSLLEVGREKNDAERARVLAAIADAAPDLLAFTGDMVFDGGAAEHWAEFDRLSAPVRARGIPAVFAFGNHEYWAGRAPAEANAFARFPLAAGRHWYEAPLGDVRLLLLDSNQSRLSPEEWTAQRTWLEATLARCDADPHVRGVLVVLHHSPFNNSTVTGDEPAIQRDIVPPFGRAQKTLALLGGHVHSYERFVRDGKTYVVSGGGGGPRAELATGAARRHPDDLFDGPPIRDFHFTIYTETDRGLEAEVRGLPKGGSVFYTMDRFSLPFPR